MKMFLMKWDRAAKEVQVYNAFDEEKQICSVPGSYGQFAEFGKAGWRYKENRFEKRGDVDNIIVLLLRCR